MSDYASPPRRGRTATAVVLAIAVVAVIGAVVGYLTGVSANQAAGGAGASPGRTAAGPTVTNGTPATSTATTAAASTATPRNTQSATSRSCPDFILDGVTGRGGSGPLALQFYIRTNGSEVWICRDAGGKLWYQGHRIGKDRYPNEKVVEGNNGLLLSEVRQDGDRYVAVNRSSDGKTTTYTVSAQQLHVEGPNQNETQNVVEKQP